MLRNTFIIAALLCLLIGCRPSAATATATATGTLGDNSAILKTVFDSALGGYQLEGAELQLSGTDSNEEFSRRGSVTVKEANQQQVADLLNTQIDKLPLTHKWNSYGSGSSTTRRGDSYLGFTYANDVGKYYVDLIFTQNEKDVEIFVLSKGVKR